MNINDSTNPNLALRASQSAQGVSKSSQQGTIKPVAPVVDENNSNKNSPVNKDQSRFEVNEQAIAFLDEQRASESESTGSAIALSDNSDASNGRYSQDQQQTQNSEYDQPSQQNLSAVAAYQSVDNIAQKESIKQFFGVNLFA